ncbi:NAD-dependent epimerase/dehydratase family protein [Uliginosibacterium gangwonense]|uniref:NAD-dependent epimerase/dehydratase family protein n=1 Tax=Uliginosibacterium gangwonense TaxID=392736 RepID=UPI000378BF5F|nr:NAD(P)-dependent oxidoreductase [Uliginosibacterium gangwonense]
MLYGCLRADWEVGVSEQIVGILGARSFVGSCLLSRLVELGHRPVAFSRTKREEADNGVIWKQTPESDGIQNASGEPDAIPCWICVAPIWVLPAHFAWLEACGVRKIVALSSTSRFTKDQSIDAEEQLLAKRLADAEAQVQQWAERLGIEWVILRPTLIYGLKRDKNVSEIARFICRFGFFPVFGLAQGLRQPIHAQDVANACVLALATDQGSHCAYNISGGEVLSYRNMVTRVFVALGRRPRTLTLPFWVFRFAVALVRCIPRYRHLSVAMAERMNRDLVFDHSHAARALGFIPRQFTLSKEDLP